MESDVHKEDNDGRVTVMLVRWMVMNENDEKGENSGNKMQGV